MAADSVRFDSIEPRDVALVVLEELSVSTRFRSWLLEAIGFENESATVLEVRESVADADGNADGADADRRRSALEVDLDAGGDRVRLVLIVALDADDARGLESGSALRSTTPGGALDEPWGASRTVLIAPNGILERVAAEPAVPFESVRDRFAARESDRGDYRAALVDAAIERGARDTTAAAGPPSIVEEYRSLVTDREPAFELLVGPDLETESDATGIDAVTVAIDAPSLADDHRLVHDLERGTVDLRIPGAADHLQPFAARHAAAIPPATELLTDGDALVLRLSVPPLDPDSSDVAPAIDETLATVRDLLTVSERVGDRGA